MHACKTLLLEVVQAVYYLWYSIALFKSVYGILCKYFTQNMSIQHCLPHGQKDVRRHSFSTFFYLLTKKGLNYGQKIILKNKSIFTTPKLPCRRREISYIMNQPAFIRTGYFSKCYVHKIFDFSFSFVSV